MRTAAALLVIAHTASVFVSALTLNETAEATPFQDWNGTQLVLLAETPAQCMWESTAVCKLDDATTLTKKLTKCDVKVPVPTDNYVADKRKNKFDIGVSALKEPFVQLSATKDGDADWSDTSSKSTWLTYATTPTDVQDEIELPGTGVYSVKITANDYGHEATCTGCIAVQDTFRPRFKTGTCSNPVSSHSTLSTDELNALIASENAYQSLVGNVNNNDVGSTDCSSSVNTRTIFYGSSTDIGGSGKCFEGSLSTAVAALKTRPFTEGTADIEESVIANMPENCKWSCARSISLKENYVPFSCAGGDTTGQCVGNEDETSVCSFNAVVKVGASDIVTEPTIAINGDVQTASKKVIDELSLEGADKTKDVYVSVPCTTDFDDPACDYTAKLKDLLSVTTGWNENFPHGSSDSVNDFVSWRYNSLGGSWKKWSPTSDAEIVFSEDETTVVVEAWTACGRVLSHSFDVKLYVHGGLVCPAFDEMWTPKGVKDDDNSYCTQYKSDFSIVDLSVSLSEFLKLDANEVSGDAFSVACTITIKDEGASKAPPATPFVSGTITAATPLDKEFAVELVRHPVTAEKTAAIIECTFTRTFSSTTETDTTEACKHTIVFKDCEEPVLDVDGDDVCLESCYDNEKPGLHEACSGLVVTSKLSGTGDGETTTWETEKECCDACAPTTTLTCTEVPESTIKRCEVAPPISMFLAQSAATKQGGLPSGSTAVLLGTSAMIAVVALFAAKQRVGAAKRLTIEDDAYYPLLE